MKINEFKIHKLTLNKILIFSIIIATLGFITDFKNTFKYGGMDLRNRVIGARLLIDGADPYYHKWDETMSERFLDPHDCPLAPVNRVTVPPTVLTLHSIIASLHYKIQRIIWFIFQWVLFLLSLVLFSKSTKLKYKSKLIWIIGLFFISGSYYWRLHVEKGQIYILYVFLITLSFWLSQQNFKTSSFLSGFFIGLTASLRPPVIFMSIPLFIYKKWKLLLGNIIGLMMGLSSSFILGNISVWKKYSSAMQIWGKIHLGIISRRHDGFSQISAEGLDNLTILADIPLHDSSLQYVFKTFLGISLSSNLLIIFLGFSILFFSIFMYNSRNKHVSIGNVFLIGITLVFLCEFFIPAARLSYNDIIWLIPLSLIIINYDLIKLLLNPVSVLLLLSIIFSTSFHLITCHWLISDYAMLLFTISIVLLFLRDTNIFQNNSMIYTDDIKNKPVIATIITIKEIINNMNDQNIECSNYEK